MKVLLDEMYPSALAERLQAAGVDATTVTTPKLTGSPDTQVFAAIAPLSSGAVTVTISW